MVITFLDAFTTNPGDISFDLLTGCGEVSYFDFSSQEEGWLRGNNAEIIITNKYKVDEEALSHWTDCKYICVAATGYNNIDLEACKKRNIKVSNVRGYSTDSVVQHVFACLLNMTNRSHYYFDEVRKGRWADSRDFSFFDHSFIELKDKVLGVYGQGNIGEKVALLGKAFGMNVKVVSKYPERNPYHLEMVNPDELFETADYLSLHVPLTQQTTHLISKQTLSKMKSDATLINTGRGPLVNELDLAEHLKQNSRFTAILDVLASEPPEKSNPLIPLLNCYITPHIAWASKEARKKLVYGIVQNLKAYQRGEFINLVSS